MCVAVKLKILTVWWIVLGERGRMLNMQFWAQGLINVLSNSTAFVNMSDKTKNHTLIKIRQSYN